MNNIKFFNYVSLPEMYNLDVGDGNSLYLEVSGKKDGIPIMFLHGGPGGHCRSEHHKMFDPEIFKSIIFDQRGCGKSKPYRIVEGNNTHNLVEDIEKIREFLKIENFYLVGGSWGATLALCYAEEYPNNIKGIILRSVFLGTMEEIKWAFIDGPKIFAPELYRQFLGFLDPSEILDPINSYFNKIHNDKSSIHSWVWHDYERILSQINPESHLFDSKETLLAREGTPNSPFMETLYIDKNFFLEDNHILNNIHKLEGIPGYIVQGRYDLICPPLNAFALNNRWKNSKIKFVNTAGHSSSDYGIMENLFDGLKEIIKS